MARPKVGADPIVTEIIRHGLNSAAEQMKRAMMRTAFSPVIYEVLDFAVAIYDRRIRLIGQALGMPHFMSRLGFGIEATIDAVGGEAALEPGDVLFHNIPYLTGAHANDAAVLMPVFLDDGELIGYTAVTAHWMDIGGKDPYSTDTVDVYQEGTIFPGVKLYSRGEPVQDIFRIIRANNRFPALVEGDLNAEVVGLHAGAEAFRSIVERHGTGVFEAAVERMLDDGEAVIRAFFEKIPDGRYVGRAILDSDGVNPGEVPFDVVVEVSGSSVLVDYTGAPDALEGPLNSPRPGTVSSTRVAIMMLAGGGDAPNEGYFRPIEVRTRPGSMFEPLPPAPCFLYGWAFIQAVEAIYNAIAQANPEAAPAWSGGCILTAVVWGVRSDTGEAWAHGTPHPVGQGAHHGGDGTEALMHNLQSGTRITPAEVLESRYPWRVERLALAPDSGGPGEHRGGLGIDYALRMLDDAYLTSVIERTQNPPLGIWGGGPGRRNAATVVYPDGREVPIAKATRVLLPAGSTLNLHSGGGGGYGDPARRDPELVERDLREGRITPEHAKEAYPHAVGRAARPG
jgi:N-methylhydantoinase B